MKDNSLVKYKLTVQFLSQKVGDGIDADRNRELYTDEQLYDNYKTAKKEALKILKENSQREISKLTIEPVLLQENLLG